MFANENSACTGGRGEAGFSVGQEFFRLTVPGKCR